MKTILVLSILLMSCITNQEHVEGFSYIKDARTNLCFALSNMGSNQATMTNVPCTEEVEKQIKIDSERNKRR